MKETNQNDSSAPLAYCTTHTSLRRVLALEGKTPPDHPNPLELATQLAPRFGFLPRPLFLEVNGDQIAIEFPAEPESAKARAAQLSRRAAKRAAQGDYEAASRLWRLALEKQPSLHESRRDLAHACIELNDIAQAAPLLLDVVSWDPADAWALGALGVICFRQWDYERSERFITLALALEPRSAEWLANLGMLYEVTGRPEQAIGLLQQAIDIDPTLPGPHYALAKHLSEQGNFKESAAAIERLFASAKPSSRSQKIFDSARSCFATCQRELAQQNHQAAARTVGELQAETEKLIGCPVRITFQQTRDHMSASGVSLAMAYDHHDGVVQCQLEGPANDRLILMGGALLNIQAGWGAARAGKKRVPFLTHEQVSRLVSLFSPAPGHLSAKDRIQRAAIMPDMALLPFYGLMSSAPLMVVETRLKQRFPELRPAQFLSLPEGFLANWRAREAVKATQLPRMPRQLERVVVALCGLEGLFLDDLFGGVTALAGCWREADGFDLSRKLWQHWQSKAPSMEPGDEYVILEDFAEILRLSGKFDWVQAPFVEGYTPDLPLQ
jgi:tetratricopeptide (TPR) repeat protein